MKKQGEKTKNEMKKQEKEKNTISFLLSFLRDVGWKNQKEKDKKAHKKSQTTQSKNFIFQSG
jgi:hypothetical protein